MPTADDLPKSRVAFVLASFLAAVLIPLLIAYPAEKFSKAYERNEGR